MTLYDLFLYGLLGMMAFSLLYAAMLLTRRMIGRDRHNAPETTGSHPLEPRRDVRTEIAAGAMRSYGVPPPMSSPSSRRSREPKPE